MFLSTLIMNQTQQKHHTRYGEAGFKFLVTAVGMLKIKFSSRHNAMWGLEDASRLIASMSERSACAHYTAQKLALLASEGAGAAVPSSAWLLAKLGHARLSTMEKRCDAMLHYTAAEAVGRQLCSLQRSHKAPVLAIDETKLPRYDKKTDIKHLVKSKRDRGTINYEQYMTCKLTSKAGADVHTACRMVTEGDKQADLVRNMLKKCAALGITPRLGSRRSIILLDRGFFSVDVMDAISEPGFAFIMPAVKTPGIKRAIVQRARGKRKAVSRYTMRSSDGKEFTFTLVIKKIPRSKAKNVFDRYHVFATTVRCCSYRQLFCHVTREYRNRWGIETGYRCAKSVRPRTVSRNPVLRVLLFYMSLAVCNIWLTMRDSGDPKTRVMALLTLMYAVVLYSCCLRAPDADRIGVGRRRHDPG